MYALPSTVFLWGSPVFCLWGHQFSGKLIVRVACSGLSRGLLVLVVGWGSILFELPLECHDGPLHGNHVQLHGALLHPLSSANNRLVFLESHLHELLACQGGSFALLILVLFALEKLHESIMIATGQVTIEQCDQEIWNWGSPCQQCCLDVLHPLVLKASMFTFSCSMIGWRLLSWFVSCPTVDLVSTDTITIKSKSMLGPSWILSSAAPSV
jgi:hypothetical protein